MQFIFSVDRDADAWINAVYSSSYEDARRLLRPDQDVNVRGAGGQTAMHVLVRHNQLEKIQTLMLEGADPSMKNSAGRTPLRIAQAYNHTDVVRFLIHHDELVRALAARQDQTPDGAAAINEDELARFRRDVRERVEENSTKLVAAARNGDLDTVRRMVENHEITIDAVDGSTGETAFAAALAAKRTRVIEYLLAHRAHIFAPCIVDGKMQAPLVRAVTYGDVSLIGQFEGYESVLAIRGLCRRTCVLVEAMKLGSIEMVSALLKIGVYAAELEPGMELLPSRPSDARDIPVLWPMAAPFDYDGESSNKTPWRLLEMACWLEDYGLIEHLFEMFDEFSIREVMATWGTRALRLAVCRQNARLVTKLLDRGVPINQEWNANAIVAAVMFNSVEMMHLLMNHGGDITVNFGHSADGPRGLLSNALTVDAMDCASELLRLETRPEILDEALAVAAKLGKYEFLDALLDTALPSTFRALETCFKAASCPLMLDLLLSRGGMDRFQRSSLSDCFASVCPDHTADFISVLLAYGVNANHNNAEEILRR